MYMAVDLALVADVLPDKDNAAKDLGVFNIAGALPSSIAPAIAPAILAIGSGSYGVLYAVAGVCAVVGAVAILPVKRSPMNAVAPAAGAARSRRWPSGCSGPPPPPAAPAPGRPRVRASRRNCACVQASGVAEVVGVPGSKPGCRPAAAVPDLLGQHEARPGGARHRGELRPGRGGRRRRSGIRRARR